MANPLAVVAARNNAAWCDAVCRTHSRPDEFSDLLWLNRHGAPRFYPDIITIADGAAATAQRDAIAALLSTGRADVWSVKDSHAALDLSSMGFRPLFDAQWIALPSPAPSSDTVLRWSPIGDAAGLAAWIAARGDDAPLIPALLAEDSVTLVAAWRDDAIVGGGIFNRAAGVVGLSNVFAAPAQREAIWRDLPAQAARSFPGLALVGYEKGGDLDAARATGFDIVGPLRVWTR